MVVGLLALLACNLLFAEKYEYPKNKGLITINIPDSWVVTYNEGIMKTHTAEEEIYMDFESVDVNNVTEVMEAAFKYVETNGVKVDPESVKTTESKLNGMDVVEFAALDKDKDGACEICIGLLIVSDTKGVVYTYWGSTKHEKKFAKQISGIINSIKKK